MQSGHGLVRGDALGRRGLKMGELVSRHRSDWEMKRLVNQ